MEDHLPGRCFQEAREEHRASLRRKQKLKPRNTRNFTKGMRYHVMLVSPFWKNHKISQGLLISCYFVTFVVPSSEAASKHLFYPNIESRIAFHSRFKSSRERWLRKWIFDYGCWRRREIASCSWPSLIECCGFFPPIFSDERDCDSHSCRA